MSDTDFLKPIRTNLIIFFILIWVQFWLGMTINLEVALSVPISYYTGVSIFIYFITHYALIDIHIILGLLILLVSIRALLLAIPTHLLSLTITAVVGLAAIAGALYNGIMFLASDQFFGYSIGMSMSAVSSIIAYSVSLYYLGLHRVEESVPRI